MRSMGYLRQAAVSLHIVLAVLDGVEKQRRRQQIRAASGRYTQCQQASVEALQFLTTHHGGGTSGSFHFGRSFLGDFQCLHSASIQQARIVQAGHNAQKSIESCNFLCSTTSPPAPKHWQTNMNDVRESVQRLTACTGRAVPYRYRISV